MTPRIDMSIQGVIKYRRSYCRLHEACFQRVDAENGQVLINEGGSLRAIDRIFKMLIVFFQMQPACRLYYVLCICIGKSAHYSRHPKCSQNCLISVELVLLYMFHTIFLMGN